MNDKEKIKSNICIYCDGKLSFTHDNDHKKCDKCESKYWYRDDENLWRSAPSDKFVKEEMSDEFRGIISHALLGTKHDISKETFNLICNECAKYCLVIINNINHL